MKEYTITFTAEQLQSLIDVINEAPMPRKITDPVMMHLERSVMEQQKVAENGSKEPTKAKADGKSS